jgi:hypothetical protein
MPGVQQCMCPWARAGWRELRGGTGSSGVGRKRRARKKAGDDPGDLKFEFFFSPSLLQEMAPPRQAFHRSSAAANFTTSDTLR